jgi:hypothetical protein
MLKAKRPDGVAQVVQHLPIKLKFKLHYCQKKKKRKNIIYIAERTKTVKLFNARLPLALFVRYSIKVNKSH